MLLKLTIIVVAVFTAVFLYTGICQAAETERTPDQFIFQNHKKIEKIIQSNKSIYEMRQNIRQHMNEFVDFNKFASLTLTRDWQKMSKAKQAEFSKLLKNLISKTYCKRFKPDYSLKVDYVGETEYREDKSRIRTILTTRNITSYVEYRMHQPTSTSEWWVYDIIIDDVSMMRNYRRQFYEILKSGGTVDTIIRRMRKGTIE